MKGQETLSSRRDGDISGGRGLCRHRKGDEPKRRQLVIAQDAGKSEWKRQGSEQTSSPASEVFARGEIFGRAGPRVGGGGSQGVPVARVYPSGSTLSWERRNPPSWYERWHLYLQRLPVRICCWCGMKGKKQ